MNTFNPNAPRRFQDRTNEKYLGLINYAQAIEFNADSDNVAIEIAINNKCYSLTYLNESNKIVELLK